MNNRLQSFLNAENLTQSQFADSIGVARASISHILSGRNKPGFDLIENIARKYPNLNLEWLITGKGKMYGSPIVEQVVNAPTASRHSAPSATRTDDDNLFPDDDLFSASKMTAEAEISASPLSPAEPPQNPSVVQPQTPAPAPGSTQALSMSSPLQPAEQQHVTTVPLAGAGKKQIDQIIIFYQDGTFSKVY